MIDPQLSKLARVRLLKAQAERTLAPSGQVSLMNPSLDLPLEALASPIVAQCSDIRAPGLRLPYYVLAKQTGPKLA